MSDIGHKAELGKYAAETVRKLEVLPENLNAVSAFFLGLFFGAIGIGIYLRSWKDFFVCMGLFIGLLIVLFPTGPGEVLGPIIGCLFSAVYGAYRVSTSNERRSHA